jgi:hypothetical protein
MLEVLESQEGRGGWHITRPNVSIEANRITIITRGGVIVSHDMCEHGQEKNTVLSVRATRGESNG